MTDLGPMEPYKITLVRVRIPHPQPKIISYSSSASFAALLFIILAPVTLEVD